VTGAVFLTFWAAIPWYRHNWIDEEDRAEDEEADDQAIGDQTAANRDL